MKYDYSQHEWTTKDGSLSDKTASKEFGLSQNDIINAIREGKLQFREGSTFGYPFLRLLRSEVEKLAEDKFGKNSLVALKAKIELKKINKELKELKLRVEQLEQQKQHIGLILKNGLSATASITNRGKK